MSEEAPVRLGTATFLVSVRSSNLLVETGQLALSELLMDEREPFLLQAATEIMLDSQFLPSGMASPAVWGVCTHEHSDTAQV